MFWPSRLPTLRCPFHSSPNYNRRRNLHRRHQVRSDGGLDGDGSALSANLLGSSEVWHNTLFEYGVANANKRGQRRRPKPSSLPRGQYYDRAVCWAPRSQQLPSQPFIYSQLYQWRVELLCARFSDWVTLPKLHGQRLLTMGYRDSSGGSEGNPGVNVYGYSVP